MFQHRQRRCGLVERVKVHTWCAELDQAFTQLRDDFFAEGLNTGFVIAKTGELEQNPAWNFRAAGFGKARQTAVIGDRHDTGNDGLGDACFAYFVNKTGVGVGIVEVLGDGHIRAGVHFVDEVFEVVLRGTRLRMVFGVGGDDDLKMFATVFTNEFDQIGGVVQFAHAAHTRWQVTAQRNDAVDALRFEPVQNLGDFAARRADAGQMRCGLVALRTDVGHGVEGAFLRGAACAVGDGEKFGRVRRELGYGVQEFFFAFRCFRWEEFKGYGDGDAHVVSLNIRGLIGLELCEYEKFAVAVGAGDRAFKIVQYGQMLREAGLDDVALYFTVTRGIFDYACFGQRLGV